MITLLILIFIIAIILITVKNKKTKWLAASMVVIVFILTAGGVVPSVLLNWLESSFVKITKPEWKQRNVIVLLGAGTVKVPTDQSVQPAVFAYSRINETARLYLNCIKSKNQCTVIISGGDAVGTGQSEAAVYADALYKLGVRQANVKLESHSMNTYQNAERIQLLLKNMKFDQVLLVTSGIHLKRALLYLAHFGIFAVPAPADYISAPLSIVPLGYNLALTDFAIHELAGIIRFRVYNLLGWNTSQPNKPRAL